MGGAREGTSWMGGPASPTQKPRCFAGASAVCPVCSQTPSVLFFYCFTGLLSLLGQRLCPPSRQNLPPTRRSSFRPRSPSSQAPHVWSPCSVQVAVLFLSGEGGFHDNFVALFLPFPLHSAFVTLSLRRCQRTQVNSCSSLFFSFSFWRLFA